MFVRKLMSPLCGLSLLFFLACDKEEEVVLGSVNFEEVAVTGPYFTPRFDHEIVSFKNKMWVIGGKDDSFDYQNDVWSSEDGKSWTMEANIGERFGSLDHKVFLLNDQLWVIGGNLNPEIDLWHSTDGKNWNSVDLDGFYFSDIFSHQVVVFKDKVWLLGGKDHLLSSSADGLNWTSETPQGLQASGYEVAVFNDKIWLVGGSSNIVCSEDGINWQQVTETNADFTERIDHQLVVYNDRLWVIGGRDEIYQNDVWTSEDGVTWNKETNGSVHFTGRYRHQSFVHDEKLWLIGGWDGVHLADVWQLTD